MNARELKKQETAIDEALTYGETLAEGTPERAMVARYVCVLASGFLEDIVRTRLSEYTKQCRPKTEVEAFVIASVDRFQNPEFDKIIEIAGRFNASWRTKFEALDRSIRDAITSIVANRHLIAHGRHSGISLAQISEYVRAAKSFKEEFNKICS
jgi:hypothetical protein